MAKEDDILKSFLKHPVLAEKYEISEADLPSNVGDGINSKIPIIQAISFIVKNLEKRPQITDKDLQTQIIQILNNAAL